MHDDEMISAGCLFKCATRYDNEEYLVKMTKFKMLSLSLWKKFCVKVQIFKRLW